jgi:hypothetical protein
MRTFPLSFLRLFPAALLASLIVACSQPAEPPAPTYRPIATTKELMEALDPIADGFWEPVGTVMTQEGTFDKAPSTDEEWAAVRSHAIMVREAGSMLLHPSKAGGNAEWIKQANALIETTDRAIKAIDAKDPKALFDVGAEVYEACVNCHRQFHPDIVKVR